MSKPLDVEEFCDKEKSMITDLCYLRQMDYTDYCDLRSTISSKAHVLRLASLSASFDEWASQHATNIDRGDLLQLLQQQSSSLGSSFPSLQTHASPAPTHAHSPSIPEEGSLLIVGDGEGEGGADNSGEGEMEIPTTKKQKRESENDAPQKKSVAQKKRPLIVEPLSHAPSFAADADEASRFVEEAPAVPASVLLQVSIPPVQLAKCMIANNVWSRTSSEYARVKALTTLANKVKIDELDTLTERTASKMIGDAEGGVSSQERRVYELRVGRILRLLLSPQK